MTPSRVFSGCATTVVSRPVLVSLVTRRCIQAAAVPSYFSSSSTALTAASTRSSLVAARTETREVAVGRPRPASSQSRSFLTMPAQEKGQTAGAAGEKKAKKPPAALRPSSSILLLSPTNQVLLLHRVHTSTSFASAHVFPGGNLSAFHDGALPAPDSPGYHQDGPAYRLAAIRETFEESGILLAKKAGQTGDQGLLHVPDEVREAGRKAIHGNKIKFTEWLKSIGGEPDVDNLVPFTRWITPYGPPKRFTTQMYLYMLPISAAASSAASSSSSPAQTALIPTPTHDGGLEHTAATFASPHAWLAQARAGAIILFPPQFYLLTLVSQFLPLHLPLPTASPTPESPSACQAQRAALLAFLQTPQSPPSSPVAQKAGTHAIAWADKVMSPAALLTRKADGRIVLALDRPGPELKGSGRGGDWERVVLVRFGKDGPREVEVRGRGEVLEEERGGEGEAKL